MDSKNNVFVQPPLLELNRVKGGGMKVVISILGDSCESLPLNFARGKGSRRL